MGINEANLRLEANDNTQALLITKLHTRYKFPDKSLEETTLVTNRAISKWSGLLSSYKSKAKNEHLDKDYKTDIKLM